MQAGFRSVMASMKDSSNRARQGQSLAVTARKMTVATTTRTPRCCRELFRVERGRVSSLTRSLLSPIDAQGFMSRLARAS